jgi:hypothetical protein
MVCRFWTQRRRLVILLMVSALSSFAPNLGALAADESAIEPAVAAADLPGKITLMDLSTDKSTDACPDVGTTIPDPTPPPDPTAPTVDGSSAAGSPCWSWTPGEGVTFRFTPDKWCNIDPQLRTSFDSVGPEGVPKGGNYFAIDNFRLFFTGQVTKVIGFEFSTDISGAGGQGLTDSAKNDLSLPDTIHLLDADVRFDFNDFVKFWAGRFRPPSDRTNLSGPFFINMWDVPFVSKYPSIFLGRDDGAAYWGEWIGENGGQMKWQLGVFNGQGRDSAGNDWPQVPGTSPNPNGDPEFAARVVVNLLDPEPDYYNFSTYYGQKNILAIGFALQTQRDAVTDTAHHVGSFTGWNVDFLAENKLNEWGSACLEGAYYNYDVGGDVASAVSGKAGFVFAGWLLPQEIGCCGVCGRFRPFVRYQRYDYDDQAAAAAANEFSEGWDFGVEYVIKGHNARFTNFYGTRDIVGGPREDIYRTGLQIVF